MITELKQPEVIRAERIVRENIGSNITVLSLPYLISRIYRTDSDDLIDTFNATWHILANWIDVSCTSKSIVKESVTVSSTGTNLTLRVDISDALAVMITQKPLLDVVPAPNISTSKFLTFSETAHRLEDDAIIKTVKIEDGYLHLVARDLFKECVSTSPHLLIKNGDVLLTEVHDDTYHIRTSSTKWLNAAVADRTMEKYPHVTSQSMIAEVVNAVALMKLSSGILENDPPIYAKTYSYAITVEQHERLLGFIAQT